MYIGVIRFFLDTRQYGLRIDHPCKRIVRELFDLVKIQLQFCGSCKDPLDSAVGAAAAGGNIPLAQPAFEVKAKYLSVHGHINDLPCVIYAVRVLRKGTRNTSGLAAVTLGSFA